MDLTTISSALNKVCDAGDASLQKVMDSISAKETPSSVDLAQLQQAMQQWTLTVDMRSTVMKALADALKGIVQKSG